MNQQSSTPGMSRCIPCEGTGYVDSVVTGQSMICTACGGRGEVGRSLESPKDTQDLRDRVATLEARTADLYSTFQMMTGGRWWIDDDGNIRCGSPKKQHTPVEQSDVPEAAGEWQKLADEILDWSSKTFGADPCDHPTAGVPSLHHLREEIEELIESPGKQEEWADCMMLLLDAHSRRGGKVADLLAWVREKLEVNKARNWGPPDENGVCHHVPAAPAATTEDSGGGGEEKAPVAADAKFLSDSILRNRELISRLNQQVTDLRFRVRKLEGHTPEEAIKEGGAS